MAASILPVAVPSDRCRPAESNAPSDRVLPFLILLLLTAAPLCAQGVDGAAIGGRVLDSDSAPVLEAIVLVTNGSNGERWQSTTNASGRYFLENLSVGGPYQIEVRAIGFKPATRDGVFLGLGQYLVADFTLLTSVVQLEELTVSARSDPNLSSSRTGPAQVISDSTIARVPVNRRDYTELALLSPQVTQSPNGGLSFVGQHDRYNSIQVDGTNNNDPFGKSNSGNGTPGWAVGLTSFTPEAVKELQVLSAPFDVRYGNFSGGLINAVTKSGTNRVEGSILGNFESSDLVGTDASGSRGNEFSRKEVGMTLGAPIVRDRVALFVNAAASEEAFPQVIPVPGSNSTGGGISQASLVRFQDLLRGYGVDPGSFSAGEFRGSNRNLFAKVTAQLGVNSSLAISHNYGHGNAQDETGARDYGFYSLSSSGTENPETINATRLAWIAAFGNRFFNKLIVARIDDQRTCNPNAGFPAVDVWEDGELFAGTAAACLGLETGHTTWEITDNFGVAAGNHQLTFGTHAERIDLVDDVLQYPGGLWFFNSLDSLERGEAASYVRDLPAAADSQVAFRVNQIGAYAQDQWMPARGLTLTLGLRFDVPYLPTPPTQNATALNQLGINTALTPSGNVLWSPRLGVNYDVSGRGTTVLRGGAGFFAGPPAYVWFRTVYGSTGFRALRLECTDSAVPAFTLDPSNQPTACAQPSPVAPPLAYFDPDFHYPRTLKVAFGVDHLLPGGIVGTLDFLYSRGVNTVHLVDVNLTGPVGVSAGEGGRTLYGSIDPVTGEATPSRRSNALGGVFEMRNGSGDRSYSITAVLGKRFANGTELSAAYTYTDARDRMGMGADLSGINVASTPVNGTLEQRDLATSWWARPHKVTLVATTNLPLGFRFGFTYAGMSGTAYTYILNGDPNADGFRPFLDVSNDAVYVPRDAGDITLANPAQFAALDRYIRAQPCLQNQRGRIMSRNSCRNPWVHETSARMAKRFGLGGTRGIEVTADLFNVMNFLDGHWGLVRETAADLGKVPLMDFLGYDTVNGRGIYRFTPVIRREINVDASRWRVQFGSTVFF